MKKSESQRGAGRLPMGFVMVLIASLIIGYAMHSCITTGMVTG